MDPSALQEKVLQATKTIEKQVDAAIEKIDSLDVNDLEQLRKQRVKEMRELEAKRRDWLSAGHGEYEELPEEKMFFETIKRSENVVVHFFTRTSQRSPILDHHLKILAPKHLETRFVSMNAEKCPFLAERLKIKTIPTLVLTHNGVMVDKIIGFTQLGNRDDFPTEMLEWRIAHSNVINYDGDLTAPPGSQEQSSSKASRKKIREGIHSNAEDEDLEIEDYASKSGEGKANCFDLSPEEAAELGLDGE